MHISVSKCRIYSQGQILKNLQCIVSEVYIISGPILVVT